jgi:hypothetical protein
LGYRIISFPFVPKEDEQLDVNLRLQRETRSVIHGTVKNECGKVVKDAVVKLYKIKDIQKHQKIIPITHTFTDQYGQFLFGPLCAHQKYIIKVWFNDVKIRELEVLPEPTDNSCLGNDSKPSCEYNDNPENYFCENVIDV